MTPFIIRPEEESLGGSLVQEAPSGEVSMSAPPAATKSPFR